MVRPPQDIWQAALGELELLVSRANFRTWLQSTTGIAVEGDIFVVGVPNSFAQEWLEQRLQPHIRNTLAALLGRPVKVRFSLLTPAAPPTPISFAGLNPAYSFASFVVGQSNLVAHCAATEAAERPGQVYNPLLVWGSTGLGKTHLLQAVARRALEQNQPALYLTAEQFTSQFIAALRHHTMEGFRQRFLHLRLLAVDDIEFLAGKEQTQEGFFHTFNELHNKGSQVVASAGRPLKTLDGLHRELGSRLAGGLVAQLNPPGEAERLAILHARAEQSGGVDPAVLEALAHAPVQDSRELLGRLNQVLALARALGQPPTPALAQQALGEATQPPTPLAPQAIVDAVLHHFRLPPEAFKTRHRNPQISQARQLAIYLLREEAHLSLSQIGTLVGGLTKSSVIYAYRHATHSLPQSTALSRPLAAIRSSLLR